MLEEEIKKLKEALKVVGEALVSAQEHLDFCGYGDSYERECAEDQGLETQIDEAVELFNGIEL